METQELRGRLAEISDILKDVNLDVMELKEDMAELLDKKEQENNGKSTRVKNIED